MDSSATSSTTKALITGAICAASAFAVYRYINKTESRSGSKKATKVLPPPKPESSTSSTSARPSFEALTGAPLKARVRSLNVFPIKACSGIECESAEITPNGFKGDREWLIISVEDGAAAASSASGLRQGRMMTLRQDPRMWQIQPLISYAKDPNNECRSTGVVAEGEIVKLVLTAPADREDLPPKEVRLQAARDAEIFECTVFGRTGHGVDCGDGIAAWLCEFFGGSKEYRLVRFHADGPSREVSLATSSERQPNTTQFADDAPILLANIASVDDLNARLNAHERTTRVTFKNFRPNILVDGVPAWAEDAAHEVALGPGQPPLLAPARCDRCKVPTVDPVNCKYSEENEPSVTLQEFNSHGTGKYHFGKFLSPILKATYAPLRVGDEVTFAAMDKASYSKHYE